MSTIINGTSSAITFPDSSVQNTSAIVSGYVPYANLPAGSVLQVVNVPFTNYTNTSSTSLVDVTGATITITPKFATSKVLIIVNLVGVQKNSGANGTGTFKLLRGSTGLVSWDDFFGYNGSTTMWSGQSSTNYLDSPATTSSTTYKIQWAISAGTAQINNYNGIIGSSTSTITAMEIAG
jgi:hypothetical protein